MKTKRILCTFLSALLALSCLVQAGAFSGQPDSWAAGQVSSLEEAGLLQNLYLSNKAPTAVITRGEFCQLLVNLIRHEGRKELLDAVRPMPADYFSDIASSVTAGSPGGSYSMYYAAAYGLTEGAMKNGRRAADCGGQLTREQAAKMMCALTDALQKYAGVESAPAGTAKPFTDGASVSGWAVESVNRAAALGIFQGDDAGRFNPARTLTWQEACVMADRSFQAAEEAAALRDQANGIGTLKTALKESADHYLQRSGDLYLLEHNGVRSVLQIHGGNFAEPMVQVETYHADGSSAGVKTIPQELDFCGGFCEGEDCYYLAFGQQNMEESAGKEVYRVVKYDKSWNRLGAASVTGSQSYTTIPFDFTSHTAMAEENGTLILYTARQRYLTSDGLRHQSNITIKIRTSDMSVQSVSAAFPSNHVSHSFAQYVRFDGGLPVYADHGDAYPRSFALNVEDERGSSTAKSVFSFAGRIGDNTTNARPGGLGVSADSYLFAGASSPQKGGDSLKYCNAFLTVTPKDGYPNGDTQLRWLTNFPADGKEYVAAVRLVQLNNNTFVVMWQTERLSDGASFPSFGDFCYAVFDGQGNQIGGTVSREGFAAPCSDPTVVGNRILWVRPELDATGSYSVRTSGTLKVYELEIDLNAAGSQAPVSLSLSPDALSLTAGEEAALSPVISGASSGTEITYRTSAPGVASVDGSGVVTARTAGSAKITASMTWRGRTYTAACTVTVEEKKEPAPGTGPDTGNPGNTGNTGNSGDTGNTGNTGDTGSTGSDGMVQSGAYRRTALPADGRVSHYREEWGGGQYLDLKVENGNTLTFSGYVTERWAGSCNYAVLRVLGPKEANTPFTAGVPFSITVTVDVPKLSELYGGDVSMSNSYVISMLCENFKPGDSALAGSSFQTGPRISLALDGSGGCLLQVVPR